jgi:arylsulfatase A-like enzyme/tetratricopeptide (TPR) repeat protein
MSGPAFGTAPSTAPNRATRRSGEPSPGIFAAERRREVTRREERDRTGPDSPVEEGMNRSESRFFVSRDSGSFPGFAGRVFALLLLAAAAVASPPPGQAVLPDLLLITLDTVRADHLGCYGANPSPTPNLDALARKGQLFRRAFASVPLTGPSHASIFTGLEPRDHGFRDNGSFVLSADVPVVAERLAAEGFRTAAFVSGFPVTRPFGFARGFDHFDDDFARTDSALREKYERWKGVAEVERDAKSTVDRWLDFERKSTSSRPAFTWIHLFDPHFPYVPPPPFAEAWPGDPYSGEIAFVDQQIGRIVDFLTTTGKIRNTFILVVGDHGESLGEHGESAHGVFLYDATIRVPLIAVPIGAGEGSGRQREETVSLVDVAPTLLARIGVGKLDPAASKVDLLGKDGDTSRIVFSESLYPFLHYGYAPLAAGRTADWTFMRGSREEMVRESRRSKPNEGPPEATQPDEKTERRLRRAVSEQIKRAPARRGDDRSVSDEDRKKLAALGYLSGGAGTQDGNPFSRTGLADPRDRQEALKVFSDVARDRYLGNLVKAAGRLESLLDTEPSNERALATLLEILSEFGDPARMTTALARVPRLGSDGGPELRSGRARGLALLGRNEESLAVYRECWKLFPSVEACRSGYFSELVQLEKVEEILESAAKIPPEARTADVDVALAEALHASGRSPEAISTLQQALARDPGNLPARRNLGQLLIVLGRNAEAVNLADGATAPDSEVLWFQAVAEARLARHDEAERHFGEVVELERRGAAFTADDELAIRRQFVELLVSTKGFLNASRIFEAARPSSATGLGELLYLAGNLAAEGGSFDRATELFRRSWSLDPSVPTPLFALARLAWSQGRCIEAAAALRALKESDPRAFEALASQIVDARELVASFDRLPGAAKVTAEGGPRPKKGSRKPAR